ncbi:MAG: dihydroorotate dehydrogenase [Zetaproteobacteria bacterium CG06_land_8_20_14_3_00_59_53]|nr:MAG: dihydroorotate dehydrogenase B catalytic subunit [Zetaproteobacteria bacterium CG2_30_59_37]PIO90468.1 MAG: dihydroorotate dehydrogenase B catalytic subunit [Zetaproteobacteria bacterium CG23_combo_of_CG06-09_8_20_14_all_59_86]PIQ65939.1 MAG: dihydroorotate dehydrogenase B catalytic subunit [Zetaproteobacteria bacterium CG11_big_fil_rev_8_21_14_0_20_59_439]PIU71419.1 MAG: dihydroorotate dehydrogenase [Zetaproteobacteria bacterium CG06_land_8_20_14_3_00_59_53]PIU97675.1 MAG: dihydroorota
MPQAIKPSSPIDLSASFAGLSLQTPLVLLSGCVGFGEEYTRVEGFSNADIGAVILKGTTLEARMGNAPHRVYETPSGMLNAIGLQNPGARHVIDNILPHLPHHETQFWANANGSTLEEYTEVARLFDDSPVTAIEINISCPNVKAGGVHFGNNAEMAARVVAAMRPMTKKPLITKLSPNNADIAEIARCCIEAGSDGLSVINTLVGMAVDIESRKPVIGNISGGLSGPAIKPVALWKIHQTRAVAARHGIPILGQGGICSARDGIEFAIAGSDALGLGTGLFYDPLLPAKMLQELRDYLGRHGLGSYRELVGTLAV